MSKIETGKSQSETEERELKPESEPRWAIGAVRIGTASPEVQQRVVENYKEVMRQLRKKPREEVIVDPLDPDLYRRAESRAGV